MLCSARGEVSVAPPGPEAQATAATITTRLQRGSHVHVGSRGRATALFARQANCTVGDRQHATDLWTRWGDPSTLTGQLPLFFQQDGDTACSFRRASTSGAQFFCKSLDRCPLTVYTDGTYISDEKPRDAVSVGRPQAEARTAQAGTTTVTHTKVVIDFCAGRYIIDYVDHYGDHNKTVDAGDEGGQYVHVEIEETSVDTDSNEGSTNSTTATTTNSDGSTTTVTTQTSDSGITTTTTTTTTGVNGSTTTNSTNSDSSNSSSSSSSDALSIVVSSTSDDGMCGA
jgi:hypothetical protein